MRLKRLVIALATFLAVACGVWGMAVNRVAADSTTDAKATSCAAIGGTFDAGTSTCTTDSPSLNNTVTVIVNTLSVIIGVVAVIMIVVGGFKYVTANGDSGNISSAKTTIVYAIIGLVIVSFAQVIVRFVIHSATNPPGKQKPVTTKTTSLLERV